MLNKITFYAGSGYLADTLYNVTSEVFQMMSNKNRFEIQYSYRTILSSPSEYVKHFIFSYEMPDLTNIRKAPNVKRELVIDLRIRLSEGYMSYNEYQFIGLLLLSLLKIVIRGLIRVIGRSLPTDSLSKSTRIFKSQPFRTSLPIKALKALVWHVFRKPI